MQPKYKRILLKISGEALAGAKGFGLDQDIIAGIIDQIKEVHDLGVEIGIVIGAGNFWRGRQGSGMDRSTADYMGMLATVINSVCLKDALVRQGVDARVMTAVPMSPLAENYSADVAKRYLSEGKVVIFGAGLGVPFLSTDTTGAVRGAEIGADAMLMAKNVDYIYTDDPNKNPDAKKLETIKASEFLAMNLKAIDSTAVAFCMSAGIEIKVFGLKNPTDILGAISGKTLGTTVTAE